MTIRIDVALGLIASLVLAPACAVDDPQEEAELEQLEGQAEGAKLFNQQTFGGNGRTCKTCHPSESGGTGTLNPAQIFVGGEITEAWDQVGPVIREVIAARALTSLSAATPIVPEPASTYPRLRGATALVAAPLFAAPQVA